jgi:hypothetical protein
VFSTAQLLYSTVLLVLNRNQKQFGAKQIVTQFHVSVSLTSLTVQVHHSTSA